MKVSGNYLDDICIHLNENELDDFGLRYRETFFSFENEEIGKYSRVFSVFDKNNNDKKVTLKIFNINHPETKKLAANEFIMQYKELRGIPGLDVLEEDELCYYTKEKFWIKMQFFDTSLWVFSLSKHVAESIVWRLYAVLNITRAVMNLHSKKILHNNINPKTILVKNPIELFLSYYGFSTKIKQKVKKRKGNIVEADWLLVSKEFTDPILNKDEFYSKKNDNYSLGAIIFFLLTNKLKGYDMNLENTINRFLNRHDYLLNVKIYSIFFKDLIGKMIHKDIDQRPTDKEIMTGIVQAVKDSLDYLNNGKSSKTRTELDKKDMIENPAKELVDLFFEIMSRKRCISKGTSDSLDKEYCKTLVKNNWVFFESLPETIQDKFPEHLQEIRAERAYKNMIYSDGIHTRPVKKIVYDSFNNIFGRFGKKNKLII